MSQMRFRSTDVGSGITYRWLPENRWKTLSINVFCKIPMEREKVTKIALIPRLNKRGTVSLPTLRDIAKKLEDMYGASVQAGTTKIASTQVVRFAIDLPSPHFLDSGFAEGLNLAKAMAFIWELVAKPYIIDDSYPGDRFQTEMEEHRRDILGIINNRPKYALIRLLEEISKGDPSGLPSWGVLEDLGTLRPGDTWETWAGSLSSCPISIYSTGEGGDELASILSRTSLDFPLERQSTSTSSESSIVPKLPDEIVFSEDFLPGEQTVLCMAFHTGVTQEDPRMPALMFYEGILGGFPHSKLFTNIREKESLAYSAYSSPNTWRGLVLTVVGVDDEKRERARDLIVEQVESMKKGEITGEEFENTRIGILRRLRSEHDSERAQIMRALRHEIMGGPETEQELVEAVTKVTVDDVVAIAENVQLKAVYALRARQDRQG